MYYSGCSCMFKHGASFCVCFFRKAWHYNLYIVVVAGVCKSIVQACVYKMMYVNVYLIKHDSCLLYIIEWLLVFATDADRR